MTLKRIWIKIMNFVEGKIGAAEYEINKKKFISSLKFIAKGVLNPKSKARKILLKKEFEESMKKWSKEQKEKFELAQKLQDRTFNKMRKQIRMIMTQNKIRLDRPSYDKFYPDKKTESYFDFSTNKPVKKIVDVLVTKSNGFNVVWNPTFYKESGEFGTDGLPKKKPQIING